MELFNRENQVPVLSPYDVAVINSKTAELAWVKIFVVLGMRVTTDEVANIDCLGSIVVESQADTKIASILGLDDIQLSHIVTPYNFLLILVLRTLCFKTKNFTHLLMMFL